MGDYAGSPMYVLDVIYRDSDRDASIRLKLQKSDSYALMNDGGEDVLMETVDVAEVGTAMEAGR